MAMTLPRHVVVASGSMTMSPCAACSRRRLALCCCRPSNAYKTRRLLSGRTPPPTIEKSPPRCMPNA
eukprot:7386467-Prymnesium_polylepis.2